MAVTIRDVAKAAGVSATTVSKVLNHVPTISEETCNRIHKVIEELDYHPNVRAQNFARQSTRTVVFATELNKNCVFETPHIFEIMIGLQKVLQNKNYSLNVISVTKENCMDLLGDMIAQKSIDGLVLHISIVNKELERVILKEQFPHIVLGCPDYRTQLCWIDNNNILSGEMATTYLIERGYKRIGFLGGLKSDLGSMNRYQGYLNVMTHKRMKFVESNVAFGESLIEQGQLLTQRILSSAQPPDAIVCANNHLAYGAITELLHQGKNIPKEIGLITFDAYPFTHITNPKMTTVDIDVYDMGKQAGDLILKKIRKPNLQVQTYMTLASLMILGSTK